ncbi:MAG: hypothetical protein FJ399_04495 [Verrucomicrobia bacterium]|nr:hypothetical protein [Verrucomicrobiota bacterium]
MPSLIVLATPDNALAEAWTRQVPAGRAVLRFGVHAVPGGTSAGFAAVVVLDAVSEEGLPQVLVRCPTIYVGEPHSRPFEQARLEGRARAYLSYGESATRLGEVLPLVEEVAEKQTMLEMLAEKLRRAEVPRPTARPGAADAAEVWDFVEGAIENLEARERLIAEFRRASRHLLRASHAVFFLRENDGFRADRGTSFFPLDDPLVTFFEQHPAVVDGTNWDTPADPIAELAVRNRLALWGARLLVPVHDNSRLLGLIALGVRDDGQAYDEADRTRAIHLARLLRHTLARAGQLARLNHLAEQANLGAKYMPGSLVLGPDEHPPRQVPLVVRDLIGQARRRREVCRAWPTSDQPFRASAGLIAENGGAWAYWEEASGEVHDVAQRERASRREVLRELALTLSHELGNALVSLTAFRHAGGDRPATPAHLETMKGDVVRLEHLNEHLAVMQGLHEAEPAPVDVRELAQHLGHSLGLRVEVGPDPVVLPASRKLLDFALRALIRTIGENRPEQGLRELALKVRSTGSGANLTALLSIKGRHLELEGILPEPTEDAVPNQGRLTVFLAKEILRLHRGEIHAGPGIEGTEILISVRRL